MLSLLDQRASERERERDDRGWASKAINRKNLPKGITPTGTSCIPKACSSCVIHETVPSPPQQTIRIFFLHGENILRYSDGFDDVTSPSIGRNKKERD